MNQKRKHYINEPDISVFKDREKEAEFWEKNFDKVKRRPIKIKFAKNLSETLNIRLDPKTLDRVRSHAKEKGLGPTQLIRMWILERINNKNI